MRARSVLGQAFTGYRAWWPYLVPLALVTHLAIGALAVGLVVVFGTVGFFSAIALIVVGYGWVQGILVAAVAETAVSDPDFSLGARFSAVRPCLNTLSVVWLLAAALTLAGALFFVVPGLILATYWALVVPAVVIERKGVFGAFGHSRGLVRGHGLRVFGILFVVGLVTGLASLFTEKAVFLLPVSLGSASILSELLGASIVAPFTALATTILYVTLREPRTPQPRIWA